MTTQQAINNAHGTRAIVMTPNDLAVYAENKGFKRVQINKATLWHDVVEDAIYALSDIAQMYAKEHSGLSPYDQWIKAHNLQFIGLPESQLQDLFKKFKTKN